MLKYRNFISFLTTILLYLGLGTLLFYIQDSYVGTEEKIQEKVITFTLAEYEPEPPLEIQPPEEVEPIPEVPKEVEPEIPTVEEVIPEPEPMIEKVVLKPLPIVKKKKIIKRKLKKVVKKKVKKQITKKRVLKKRTTHKTKRVNKRISKPQANPAKKNLFLAKVRSKISRAKSYPRIAQRRGMQGSVKVKFTILKNGHVSHIQVSGKKIFLKSAKQAVKKAFPISVKNIPISLPETISFTMRYQLR